MIDDIRIIQGDNVEILESLYRQYPSFATTHAPSLCYLDPPFRTGKTQSGPAGSFKDPLCELAEFVDSVRNVSRWCWKMMAPGCSLVVHLDSKMVHYVKVALDEVFGIDNFASEIIWRYRRWPSNSRNFQRVHDTLLRYVKPNPSWVSSKCVPIWNQLYEPPSASTVATWGNRKQCAVVDNGKRKRSSSTNEPSPGVRLGDVWDIPIVAPVAKERTGYPTQKPEALLERLMLATTRPRSVVLDPYMGSGTTLAVAKRIGRIAVGIDRNPQAIAVARKRMGMGES